MWSRLSNHRRWFTVIHRIFIHTFNKMAASCLWDLNWISNITELYKGRLITFTYEYIEMTYFRIIVCTLKCLIWLFLLILTVFVKSTYLGGGSNLPYSILFSHPMPNSPICLNAWIVKFIIHLPPFSCTITGFFSCNILKCLSSHIFFEILMNSQIGLSRVCLIYTYILHNSIYL